MVRSMSTYLEVENELVTGAYICDDPAFAEQMNWVGPVDNLDPVPGIGWGYDGTTWTPLPVVEQ